MYNPLVNFFIDQFNPITGFKIPRILLILRIVPMFSNTQTGQFTAIPLGIVHRT